MSIKQSDSDQNLPLTLVSSFGPPDTVAINMVMIAGQPVVTNQVVTNPNIDATNHSIANTSTSHSIHHKWVWFRLEGQSGCSLGPAQMECWSIALIIHQELGVIPLWIQQLNHQDVLIEFDSEVGGEGSSETIKDGMVDGGPM